MSALKPVPSSRDEERGPARGNDDDHPSTSWSVVRAAGGLDPVRARAALLGLADRYRGPVRAYLSSDGYTDAEADALAQQFFLGLQSTQALGSAADGNERFRVWLIRELQRFLSSDPDPAAPFEARVAPLPPRAPREQLPPKAPRARRVWLWVCRLGGVALWGSLRDVPPDSRS